MESSSEFVLPVLNCNIGIIYSLPLATSALDTGVEVLMSHLY